MKRCRRRIPGLIGLLLAAALLLGACGGLVGSLLATDSALRSAGFGSVSVNATTGDQVTVGVKVAAAPSEGAVVEVAGIVWHNLHLRFSAVDITVTGAGPTLRAAPTFADLQARFGPRNPAWNRTDVTSSVESLGVDAVAAVAALVVVAGLVVLVVVLTVRRRRRSQPPGPGAPWGQGPPPAPGQPWGVGAPSWGPPASGPSGDADPGGGWGPPTG